MGMLDDMIASSAAKMFGSGEAITLPPIAVDCAGCLVHRHMIATGLAAQGIDRAAAIDTTVVAKASTVILGTPVCFEHAADLWHAVSPDMTP